MPNDHKKKFVKEKIVCQKFVRKTWLGKVSKGKDRMPEVHKKNIVRTPYGTKYRMSNDRSEYS